MKKHRFLILCLATALVIALGAVQKHTALKDVRKDPIYLYRLTYTVEVADLADYQAASIEVGTALYLEDNTLMGTVEAVEMAPAASGTGDCCDLTLTVTGTGGKLSGGEALEYDLTEDNKLTFLTRYLTFEGTVTHVKEVDI